MYFEGNSLTRIAQLLGRPRDYVSRCFHSDAGRMAQARYRREREELRERAIYAAQGALDEIIRLATSGTSEAVRRLAAKDILDLAELAPKSAGVTFHVSDEAIARLCNVLREAGGAEPQVIDVTESSGA